MQCKTNAARAGAAAFAVGLGIALANGSAIAGATGTDSDAGPSSSESSAGPSKKESAGAESTSSKDSSDSSTNDKTSPSAKRDADGTGSDSSDSAAEDNSPDDKDDSAASSAPPKADTETEADTETDVVTDPTEESEDTEPAPKADSAPVDVAEPTTAEHTDYRSNSSSPAPAVEEGKAVDQPAAPGADIGVEPILADSDKGAAATGFARAEVGSPKRATTVTAAPLAEIRPEPVARQSDSLVGVNSADVPMDNPVSAFFAGMYDFVRRTFFNQTPTVAPRQYGQLPDGRIVGTLGAADPDGDEIVYTVVDGPMYGSLSLAADGSFMYTPKAGFTGIGGVDDFTVTARNSGFGINLLNLFAPTDTTTTVAVDLKPVIGAPTESTQGFNVWNYSSKPIQYLSMTPLSDDTSLSDLMGPAFNTIIQPGENAHFELVVYYLYDTKGLATFSQVVDDGGALGWGVILDQDELEDPQAGCAASSAGTCNPAVLSGTADVFLFDPPGTVVTIPADAAGNQINITDLLCGDGSAATCSFAASSQVETYNAPHNVGSIIQNETTSNATYSIQIADAQSQTDSLQVSVKEGFSLLEKTFNLEIQEQYGHSWTNTETFTQTLSVTVIPQQTVQIIAQDPIYQVTGTLTVTLGNTTWILDGVVLSSPNPNGVAKYTPQTISAADLEDNAAKPSSGTVEIISVTPEPAIAV